MLFFSTASSLSAGWNADKMAGNQAAILEPNWKLHAGDRQKNNREGAPWIPIPKHCTSARLIISGLHLWEGETIS